MENLDLKALLNLSSPALVGLVITLILQGVKAIPGFPTWTLPFLAFLAGGIAYPALEGLDSRNIILGIVIGGFAVGLHQGFKQFRENRPGANGFLCLLIPFLALTGCATSKSRSNRVDAEKTAAIVQASAQLGTYYALRENPDWRPYFEAASVALDMLVREKIFSPEEIQQNLTRINIEELHEEEIFISIAAAVNLYQVFFGEVVQAQLDQNTYARPVLAALKDGINGGLNARLTEHAYNLRGPP